MRFSRKSCTFASSLTQMTSLSNYWNKKRDTCSVAKALEELSSCQAGTSPESVNFLGYILKQRGVELDQSNVEAVTSWPQPTTVMEMQIFLWFYRFIIDDYWNYRLLNEMLWMHLGGSVHPSTKSYPSTEEASRQLKVPSSTPATCPDDLAIHQRPLTKTSIPKVKSTIHCFLQQFNPIS